MRASDEHPGNEVSSLSDGVAGGATSRVAPLIDESVLTPCG